ncbi:WD40 repeat domain-containing protein [Spirillospora sp. NBC_00431]
MRVRTVWTTSQGPDPRLHLVLPGIRADAVAAAVVGGVPVYVSATEPHFDGDCDRARHHDCGEAAVRVWDAATGALVRTVPDAGGTHLAVAAAGGRTVAVTCDWSDTPKIIDLDSGVVLDELTGHRDIVQGLATAALDGGPAVVSAGWDGTVRVWYLTTGEEWVFDAGERLDALSVAVLGGRVVAVVAGCDVGLWDVELGERAGSLPGTPKVKKIATWPDGDAPIALLSWDGGVQVWDAVSRTRLSCRMEGRPSSWDMVGVVTGDGRRLLALSDREAVRLWDVGADRPAGPPLVGPTSWAVLTRDGPGVVVTASGDDEALGVWRARSEMPRPAAGHTGTGHTSTVTCLAVGPGDRVVAGGTDGTVGSFRLDDGARGPVLGALPARVHAVAAAPAGEAGEGVVVLAGGGDLHEAEDDALHRWFADGPDEPVAAGHRGEVKIVVTALLDGRRIVLTAGCDETLHITDLATGERVGGVPGRHMPDGIAAGEFGGRAVAAVSRAFGPFQLWDLAGGAHVVTPVTEALEVREAVRAFVHLNEGPAVLTVRGHAVRVRDLGTAATWALDPDDLNVVTAVAVHDSVNPPAAVARADGRVSVFDLRARTVADVLELPYPATALAWTPDADLIVACRRDLLRVSTAIDGGTPHSARI